MDASTASVIVGLSAFAGTVVTAVFAYLAKRHAAQANDAVNHRHPGEPRLFDVVLETQKELEAFRDRNHDDHKEFRNGLQVAAEDRAGIRHDLRKATGQAQQERDAIRIELQHHVEWEEAQYEQDGKKRPSGDGPPLS